MALEKAEREYFKYLQKKSENVSKQRSQRKSLLLLLLPPHHPLLSPKKRSSKDEAANLSNPFQRIAKPHATSLKACGLKFLRSLHLRVLVGPLSRQINPLIRGLCNLLPCVSLL